MNALKERILDAAARVVAKASIWYEHHKLYFSKPQDLAKEDRTRGFHRRGSIYLGEPYTRERVVAVRYELRVPSTTFSLGVDLGGGDGDDELQFKMCCPPIGLYVTVEHRAIGRLFRALVSKEDQYKGGMETQVRIFDNAIWWDVWHTANEWTNGTPRWRSGNFHPVDAFFGKQDYVCETLSEHDVLIPMPERAYKAHVKLEEATWTRRRWPHWPLKLVKRTAHVDMLPGEQIPSPGKGENSWDCGDDATFGLSCPARTLEDAVGETVKCVLNSRRRYGGGTGTEPWKHEPEVPKEPTGNPGSQAAAVPS